MSIGLIDMLLSTYNCMLCSTKFLYNADNKAIMKHGRSFHPVFSGQKEHASFINACISLSCKKQRASAYCCSGTVLAPPAGGSPWLTVPNVLQKDKQLSSSHAQNALCRGLVECIFERIYFVEHSVFQLFENQYSANPAAHLACLKRGQMRTTK